jgi:multidrug efflux pump subunit AcrB
LLSSTLTTIAVFLPVIFMEEEAGQLFRDIAIAVTCAVALSLFVSVSVIPMFSRRLFELTGNKDSCQTDIQVGRDIGGQRHYGYGEGGNPKLDDPDGHHFGFQFNCGCGRLDVASQSGVSAAGQP